MSTNMGIDINMNNTEKKKAKIFYHFIITILFVYVFIKFMSKKENNYIYNLFIKYIMNRYCIILYILFLIIIMRYDKYTAVLLFIILIIPYRSSFKEYFNSEPNITVNNNLLNQNLFGIDDRMQTDDIAINKILKQIKSQVDFDPYKTKLSKDVIYEIYNRYFDNDIFVKLKNVNDDSKEYVASGNFNYLPKENKVDYDITTYQNLSNNVELGINPIIDGIANNTQINR